MFEIPFNLLVYTNFVLVIWLLIDLYRGYKQGLLLQILSWVSTFVALFVAWLFSNPFATAFPWFYKAKGAGLASGVGMATIDGAIAFQVNRLAWIVILFIIIRILLLVVTPIASFISKMPLIKQVNSFVGGIAAILLFGLKMILVCIFLTFPIVTNGQDVIDQSLLQYVERYALPGVDFIDRTVASNSGLQSIISHQELDQRQKEAVVEWLRGLDFSTAEIMEFLNSYE